MHTPAGSRAASSRMGEVMVPTLRCPGDFRFGQLTKKKFFCMCSLVDLALAPGNSRDSPLAS